MGAFEKLVAWFARGDSAMVALSGGVDSAVVALAAKRALGDKATAVTADYKTLAEEELATARKVAGEIGIHHVIIEYDELENPEFVKNDGTRCYHCRTELGQHLVAEAQKAGIKLIVDGTNVDDLSDYRPGIRALRENGVKSPMVELGITKAEIRAMAKEHGLSVYDKPSNACLASRIPAGMEVTYEKLRRIESAEIAVKSIFGVRQVRVRDHGDVARVEVGSDELAMMFDADKLSLLDSKLKEFGWKFVAIDAAGYRSGKLAVVDKGAG
ncbi:MAG: ATP-dependent sacrificial sulfur transferase LarE [Nitrososphaera sp.]|uniref:ATP-dependent sacrificial sulfur transferase LarE n=1 Tax=Nitrososphaera sp. TaxID=1971748 RepID=UPI003D700EFA